MGYSKNFVEARSNDGFTLADLMVLDDLGKKFTDILGFDERELMIRGFDNEDGYNQYADRITQTLDGADLNAMWREFQSAIAILNRQRDPFINLFGFPITNPVERVLYPTDHDFEEASEFGEPVGIRLGKPFSLGYDFRWYDIAIRYTFMFLAEASSDQVRALNSSALEASIRLQFTKILKAVFNNTDRTSLINDGQTSINVYPLYNADGFVPPPYKGTTFDGTHNHYLVSGASTVAPDDLAALETELYHHGYRVSEGYRLLLMVNRQEGLHIRTFKLGVNSALYDFIPASDVGGGVFLPASMGIVGNPSAVAPAGLTVIGTYGPFVIVEEDLVPAGYMLATATGGEVSINNLVGIREHQRPELRGLRLIQGNDFDYPLVDSFYQQGFGTGVRMRGGAAVMEIASSGSYATPAAYA